MVDNTVLNTGSGGDTIASDDIGGVKHQRVKVQHGADGSATDVSAASPLPVDQQSALPTGANTIGKVDTNQVNLVSTDNSTTTPLGIDAVFTGTGEDITKFASISIVCLTDQNSATGGLSIQFSSDNSNWDLKENHAVTADAVFANISCAHNKWFRIVYTNGGTGQGFFRLSVVLSQTPVGGHLHFLNENISDDDFAVLVHSVLCAKLPSGAYTSIEATTGGNLKVAIEEADTSATGLAKAIDNVVGATDTGIAMLGKHSSDTVHTVVAEGDYDIVALSEFNAMQVAPEQHHIIDEMDVTTGWAALGNDTINLATTTKHVLGAAALEFDKVNGAANTVFGGIDKTITSVDLGNPSPHDIIQTVIYVESVAAIDYFFLRLGTDNTAYNEWRIDGADLTGAIFETIAVDIGDASYAGITGAGIDWGALTYVAVGFAFNAETDTLANIVIDEISFHTNQHVNASINSEVTSSVSSANVNLQKVGGSPTDKGAGNVSNGSQRIVIATDDVNLSALKATMSGPAAPAIDSYTQVAINLTTGADQVLAASAANKQIWVYGYMFTCGDAAGQSVSFQDEDNVALSGIMEFAQYGGASVAPSGNFSMPIWKLGTNKDLEVDITGGDVDGWLTYAILSV